VRSGFVAALVALALGCGSPAVLTEPGAPFDFQFTDPAGDTLAPPADAPADLPPPIDLVGVSGSVTPDRVTIVLEFVDPVSPWSARVPNSLDGFLDLDTDESASTGLASAGGTGLGADYYLDLRDLKPGQLALVNYAGRSFVYVPVTFAGNTVTIEIPRGDLGDDDGQFLMSLVVGVNGQPITDIAPDHGGFAVHRPSAP
jgi:hypothetical protein